MTTLSTRLVNARPYLEDRGHVHQAVRSLGWSGRPANELVAIYRPITGDQSRLSIGYGSDGDEISDILSQSLMSDTHSYRH